MCSDAHLIIRQRPSDRAREAALSRPSRDRDIITFDLIKKRDLSFLQRRQRGCHLRVLQHPW